MKIWWLVLLLVIALAAVAQNGPETLVAMDGKSVQVPKGDSPELVLLIATRCPVSNSYNQRYVELWNMYHEKIHIVAVNPNETESNDEVSQHAKTNGFAFPIYRDPAFKLQDKWKARVTPQVYLFDKSGKLYYEGRIDDNQDLAKVKSHDLQLAIDRMLSGKPPQAGTARPFGCSIKRVSK